MISCFVPFFLQAQYLFYLCPKMAPRERGSEEKRTREKRKGTPNFVATESMTCIATNGEKGKQN